MKTIARASVLLGLAAALAAGAALAGDAATMITARHDHFKAMGSATKALTGELDVETPALPDVRRDAATLVALAALLPNWFPAGSGPDLALKTAALATI